MPRHGWFLSWTPRTVEQATGRYWATMERHKLHGSEHGEDMPKVRNWKWV